MILENRSQNVCDNKENYCGGIIKKLKYIQPPVPASCRPKVKFTKSTVPLESETIYKNSYIAIDPQEAKNCRLPAAKPKVNFKNNCHTIKMDNGTVTNLSYPGHYAIPKQNPIIPCPRSLLGEGPMQDLTTQKHDYVAKPFCKPKLIMPCGKIMPHRATCEPLECDTIQKLSFQKPINYKPVKSCKPMVRYQRSEATMDFKTTQKLSYQPHDICRTGKLRGDIPRKSCFSLPSIPMETETTYKTSFMVTSTSDCGDQKYEQPRPSKMHCPENNPSLITSNRNFTSNTIYKESYHQPSSPSHFIERLQPIKPRPCLNGKPLNVKMDTDTMYNMAYYGHYNVPKQNPIIPCPRSLLGEGPMQDLTTQKHDFVNKPYCRRNPIKPKMVMMPVNGHMPMEQKTIANLSYAKPNGFVPSVSYKPNVQYRKPNVKMETETTQKLSYMPVNAASINSNNTREIPMWARKNCYVKNPLPMDTETIQKLSYPPPGQFIEQQITECNNDDKLLCNCNANHNTIMNVYPKAAVY